MGMTHRRRVSGVSVNGNMNRNALSVDNQTSGVNVAGAKRRDSTQGGVQNGIKFLQRAEEEDRDDSDAGSSLLDDLDLDKQDRDGSDRRMRTEAKSIRKVNNPRRPLAIPGLIAIMSCRLQTLRLPTGL